MRSMDLERIKRELDKPIFDPTGLDGRADFSKIKADFETLQKTQDSIIKAFTRKKNADYAKVAESAKLITKLAKRLDIRLFGERKQNTSRPIDLPNDEKKGARSLIVELDSAVGRFVNNAIFQNPKVVQTSVSEHAQSDLHEIIRLSQALFAVSKRFN